MVTKKILIIEDSLPLLESLQDLFTLQGCTTFSASNGATGIKLALTEHPDLILLDLKLPDIDGYSALRQIRKDDWGKKTNVLILTASDLSGIIPEDLGLTEKNILSKSDYGLTEILIRVKEALIDN